jgi:Planctomycete cytochrome C
VPFESAGENGKWPGPAIQPGKVDESLLIRAILYRDDGLKMPPEEAGGKLPESEIALLTEWVRRGAHDPRTEAVRRGGMTENELRAWWSFQSLKNPVVPVVQNHDAVGSEIDRFIQSIAGRKTDVVAGCRPTNIDPTCDL